MTENQDEFEQSISNPHDAAFKSAFKKKRIAKEFFMHYLPPSVVKYIDFDHLELQNRNYIDEKMRDKHSDLVYRTKLFGKLCFLFILFEHQSTPDRRMPFRLLCYMVNLWREFEDQNPKVKTLPVILPAVIYHGKRKWNSPLNLWEMIDGGENFKRYIPSFSYELYNLNTFNDIDLRRSQLKALHVVLHLMKHIFDNDLRDVFSTTVDLVIEIDEQNQVNEALEWTLRYIFNARDTSKEEFIHLVDEETKRIDDEKIRRTSMSIAERFRESGRVSGYEEGRIKTSGLILKQLKKKFGSLSPILEKRLLESDFDMLDKFGESIFDFRDLKDAEKWWENN